MPRPIVLRRLDRGVLALLLALARAVPAPRQGAIDPNVAPRAAALEREGERQMAIDLLGHYLATAPDDGRAWLQLGRFYLFDARDWHLHGHRGDPDGLLYLDFAATALDQAVRLSVDSGVVFRGIVEMDGRSVDGRGFRLGRGPLARDRGPTPRRCRPTSSSSAPTCSPRVRRAACCSPGATSRRSRSGTAACSALPLRHPPDPPRSLRHRLRSTAARMAAAMGVDPALPVQRALAAVAASRTICLARPPISRRRPRSPGCPFRLVRVSRAPRRAPTRSASVELLKATRRAGRPGCRTSAASTTAPPATTRSSAAASSSSSGTRRRMPADGRTEMTGAAGAVRPLRRSVKTRPDRQPRRDRASHRPRLPRRRTRGGRGVFGRGPREPARARRRPGRRHRPAPPVPELSRHRPR